MWEGCDYRQFDYLIIFYIHVDQCLYEAPNTMQEKTNEDIVSYSNNRTCLSRILMKIQKFITHDVQLSPLPNKTAHRTTGKTVPSYNEDAQMIQLKVYSEL